MVLDRSDDRWREVAIRLVADTALLDRQFDRDLFGDLGPSKSMGAQVLEAGRLVLTRFVKLAERLDALYSTELDSTIRERLQMAQHQLQAGAEALTGLPEALDPNYGGWSR